MSLVIDIFAGNKSMIALNEALMFPIEDIEGLIHVSQRFKIELCKTYFNS